MFRLLALVLSVQSALDACGSKMDFIELEPKVPCGDGSPAGYYTDFHSNSRHSSTKDHIITFMGGGACTSDADCLAEMETEPYKFTTALNPSSITGDTILSANEGVNPGLASFVRWLVPYCSQDLYLGDGTSLVLSSLSSSSPEKQSTLTRAGSVQVKAVLDEWERSVLGSDVGTVVFVGVSAGASAVLNHFEYMRSAARRSSAASVRFVLDSSLYPDEEEDDDLSDLVERFVDVEEHPLCAVHEHANAPKGVTGLPCCISVQCMLTSNEIIAPWAHEGFDAIDISGEDERILLIDSMYDPFVVAAELQNGKDGTWLAGLSVLFETCWNVGEIAGSRRANVITTLYGPPVTTGPRVLWVLTSALSHTFLMPSVELEQVRCLHGSNDDVVCGSAGDGLGDGVGAKRSIYKGLKLTVWLTNKTWELATVNQNTIRDVLTHFVEGDMPSLASYNQNDGFGLIMDQCSGPNCVEAGEQNENPAQQLVEIENTFVEVPLWLQILLAILLSLLPASYIYMAHIRMNCFARGLNLVKKLMQKDTEKNDQLQSTDPLAVEDEQFVENEIRTSKHDPGQSNTFGFSCRVETGDCIEGETICIRGCTVQTPEGVKLLQNVDIDLEPSSVNGLMGLSGSGKTTLLQVLSKQVPTGWRIKMSACSDLANLRVTYMRQMDLISMENLTPSDYLTLTSQIYGASPAFFTDILSMVRPLFKVETKLTKEGDVLNVFDPFNNTAVKNLSGGQRRLLAIAGALFNHPKLLLLDEPLSGLDSASSETVITLLTKVAEEHRMTVLMTLHQPSNDILNELSKITVLAKGKTIFRRTSAGFKQSTTKPADKIHEVLVGSSDGTSEVVDPSASLGDSPRGDSSPIIATATTAKYNFFEGLSRWKMMFESFEHRRPRLSQILPLIQRMQLEYKTGWRDIILLPFCYILVGTWLRFDPGSPVQVYLVTTMFCSVPISILRHRIHGSCKMITAHRWELEDGRVSTFSYGVASIVFTYGVPVISIALAHALGYAVLGWSFNTYFVQTLFVNMYALASLQLGKTLGTYFKGNYRKLTAPLSLYIFLSFLFSGFFVSLDKIPKYISWLVYLSLTFWGLSGTVLNQFQFNDKLGEEGGCLSLMSCILLDGNFFARRLGYTPFTTAYKSMVALIIFLVLVTLLDFILLFKMATAIYHSPAKSYDSKKDKQQIDLPSQELNNLSSRQLGTAAKRRAKSNMVDDRNTTVAGEISV